MIVIVAHNINKMSRFGLVDYLDDTPSIALQKRTKRSALSRILERMKFAIQNQDQSEIDSLWSLFYQLLRTEPRFIPFPSR
jgi:hypothetical protein